MTKQDDYSERPQHHIGIVDAILLAIIAAGGYLATGNVSGTSPAFAGQDYAATTHKQQICSDEELRQMRSGPETCFVSMAPDKHEFGLEPSLNEKGASVRNAGRQPSTH
jgi:hypothetical protein